MPSSWPTEPSMMTWLLLPLRTHLLLLSPFLTLLWPYRPSFLFVTIPVPLLPPGLCTCCLLCLECSPQALCLAVFFPQPSKSQLRRYIFTETDNLVRSHPFLTFSNLFLYFFPLSPLPPFLSSSFLPSLTNIHPAPTAGYTDF